ncbi:uncharacterized protein LOC144875115 isoform X1 [Branchiostoma floridae x Branchiostoma japonicum]
MASPARKRVFQDDEPLKETLPQVSQKKARNKKKGTESFEDELGTTANDFKCVPQQAEESKKAQDRELNYLRQKIFDNLEYQNTASEWGHAREVQVTVPFSESSFRSVFLQQLSIPRCRKLLKERTLKNCFGARKIIVPWDKMAEVDAILGENWDVRTFRTNTVCRVITEEGVCLSWGRKKREIFSHIECPRCNWTENSGAHRPACCTPAVSYLVGEAELHFSFARRRGHWMVGMM